MHVYHVYRPWWAILSISPDNEFRLERIAGRATYKLNFPATPNAAACEVNLLGYSKQGRFDNKNIHLSVLFYFIVQIVMALKYNQGNQLIAETNFFVIFG